MKYEYAAIVPTGGKYAVALVKPNRRVKSPMVWRRNPGNPKFKGTVIMEAQDILHLLNNAGREGWESAGEFATLYATTTSAEVPCQVMRRILK
tara:strand:- start:139 stop:417 length:279 start_codon:yes stop_codon:yes gene_type:complete